MRESTAQIALTLDNGPVLSGTLTIEQEMVDVTLRVKTEPDMTWEYVDQSGHFHAWAQDGTLPTLVARTEHRECNGCGDDGCEGYDITVYDCAICDERIEPKTISCTPTEREYAPGLTTWRVEVTTADEPGERGERVSVRATDGERVYFGVGIVARKDLEGGPAGVRFSLLILGAGPLGQRTVRRTVPA